MPPASPNDSPLVAIACGGTGGHLFPGIAVGECLLDRGYRVILVVSRKEIDRQALQAEHRFPTLALPAVGFSARHPFRFLAGFAQSYRLARRTWQDAPPRVLLSMGGFTSAPPALAARSLGAPLVIHEANAIPGRANRWLAPFARRAFVHFPEAARRLHNRHTTTLGMPVRRAFQPADPASCRLSVGLDPIHPVLLVTGGSQGATGLNDAVLAALPALRGACPQLQLLFLTGPHDEARVRAACLAAGLRAVVRPFLTEMDLALGAADAVIARAGASSAAELAAMQVPALLVPFPHAADNHQLANARALATAGAARVLEQHLATPDRLASEVTPLLLDADVRRDIRSALAAWYRPDADVRLAEELIDLAA